MKMTKIIPALPVFNIDQAVTFYEKKLGFMGGYKEGGFAILNRDEIELHLWAASDKGWKWKSLFLFMKPVVSGAESFLAGTSSCRIQVTQIDELYDEYKEQGVLYNSETTVEETSWATREFPALDLHRNLLTFYEQVETRSREETPLS